mmetsp:Transcript_41301/g.97999  ORF Transcript_41301/g.97999 Transcript_41301/m.97999 type:complete len:531 (-) Transcript_41301:203-1795(-)
MSGLGVLPRSGTMVPDKVPRKAMGGGFRSHSPSRSKSSTKSRQPTVVQLQHSSSTVSNKKVTLISDEEAEIEKEYIKNLQQQIYYLELELKYKETQKKHGVAGGERQLSEQEQELQRSREETQKKEEEVRALRLQLEEEQEEVRQARAAVDKDHSAYRTNVDALAREVEKLEARKAGLEGAAEDAVRRSQHEGALLGSQVKSLLDANTSAKRSLESLREERDRLAENEGKLRVEVHRLGVDCQHRAVEVEEARGDAREWESKFIKAEEARKRLVVEVEQAKDLLAQTAGSLTAEEEQKLKDKAKRAVTELEMEKITSRRLQQEKEVLEGIVREAKAAESALAEERDSLRRDLQRLQAKAVQEDDKEAARALRIQVSELEASLQPLRNEVASKEAARWEAEHAKAHAQALAQQAFADQKRHEDARAKADAALEKAEQLVSTLRGDYEALASKTRDLEQQHALLSSLHSSLQRSMEEARRESHSLRTRLSVLKAAASLHGLQDLAALVQANQDVSVTLADLLREMKTVEDAP